jgi:alanyl aminopeptidase
MSAKSVCARWVMCLSVMVCMGPACHRAAKPSEDVTQLIAASTSSEVRLPTFVTPKRYALTLGIDPDKAPFTGEVAITLDVTRETSQILMHSRGLQITSASLEKDGERFALSSSLPGQDLLLLESARAIPSAKGYVLTITYSGEMTEEPSGMYRTRDGEDWYVVTQFEPLEARKAFPGFDEPRFKTPFSVTIKAPEGQVVASNAALVTQKKNDGLVTHEFGMTQPLPTYLVALTVGPYEIIAQPSAGERTGPEFRILVPRGKGNLAGYALERTPAILGLLSEYFDQPYPFAKLDFVAVPNFSAGAMENVGLVTYRDSILLIDERTATPRQKYRTQSVIAHELAHMWFGNLVTPPWWDELWLNESFATWMASYVLERLDPQLEPGLRQLMRSAGIMSADTLAQTRAIRQPIVTRGDIYNAFDGITYGKGALVLRMTEHWLGEDRFRQGVRNLMKQNAYGTVTTPLLMAALDATSGKEVGAMMSTFIDQPGVPLLSVKPLCSGDSAQLIVSQSRYIPAGSGASQTGPWRVPMCVKVSRQGAISEHCTLLTEPEQVVELPMGKGCPDWVHPNADEHGYYHWVMPAEEITKLSGIYRAELSEREQLALLGHLDALVQSGQLDTTTFYTVALDVSRSQNSHIVSEALDVIQGMHAEASRQGLSMAYAKMVREAFGAHLDRLGMEPIPGEKPSDANLRSRLLSWLGDEGMDISVMGNAKSLVPAYLSDPDAFPSWRAWAITLAATEGDQYLWESLNKAVDRAKTPAGRITALRALGAFRDEALLKQSLELFLTDRIRSNEFWYLVGTATSQESLVERVVWPWVVAHYDQLVDKLGVAFSAPSLPYLGAGFCDAEGKARVEAYFAQDGRMIDGMARNLSMSLESIDRCIERRQSRGPSIKAFLAPYVAAKKK